MRYSGIVDGGVAIRVVRAGVFSALLLVLSVGGHTLLTGAPLPGYLVAASGLIVFGTALIPVATERGFAQIAVVLVPLPGGGRPRFPCAPSAHPAVTS